MATSSLVLGIVLMLVGRAWPGRGGKWCRRCLSDLAGLASQGDGQRCAGCDADLDRPRATRSTRRNERVVLAGGIIVLVSVGVILVSPHWAAWWIALEPYARLIIGLVIGVTMVAVGRAWPSRGGQMLCRRCQYDVRGLPRHGDGWRCPECGADLDRPRATRSTRRIEQLVLAGGVIVLVSVVAFFISPRWSAWWIAHKPHAWLIAGAEPDGSRGDRNDYLELKRRLCEQTPDPAELQAFLAVAKRPIDSETGLVDGRWFEIMVMLNQTGVVSDEDLVAWLDIQPPQIRMHDPRPIDHRGRIMVPITVHHQQRLNRRSLPWVDVEIFGQGRDGTIGDLHSYCSWDPGMAWIEKTDVRGVTQDVARPTYDFDITIRYTVNDFVVGEFIFTRSVIVPESFEPTPGQP